MFQDELKHIIALSLARSRTLRANVNQIGSEMTNSPFATIRHKLRREKLEKTVKVLNDIETVRSCPATIRLLLETYDFVRANNYIKTVRNALADSLKGL